MSQKDDSESDIWDYRPLGRRKRRPQRSAGVTKRRCASTKTAKSVRAAGGDEGPVSVVEDDDPGRTGASSGGSCPVCQMPFSILVVQTQRWHVAECLDSPRDKCQECPDGLRCSSTIPSHYKKFNHTLLALGRAGSEAASLSLSQQGRTSGETRLSCPPGLTNHAADGSVLETSQDSALSSSALSDLSASPRDNHSGTPSSKCTNGLLLLRSPGPEDFKKKKGWLSSTKANQQSVRASQESKTKLSSTPVKAEDGEQACEGLQESELSPDNDDEISYSPLTEFPAEKEVNDSECKKALFNNEDAFESVDDSMVLFSEGFSSEDELLTEFIDHFQTNGLPADQSSSNTQLKSVTSLTPPNQLPNRAGSTSNTEAHGESAGAIGTTSVQSPQSVVLERLRENILNSESLHLRNSNDSIQSQLVNVNSHQVPFSQTMPPQKSQSKAGQTSSLKQTDIGVFFGLRPLKEKEKEKEAETVVSLPTLGENSGQRQQRRNGQRKSKAGTPADTSHGTVTAESCDVVNAQGGGRRSGTRGWRRRRWNRGNGGEEAELPRCPFYKKIPGTKFVIDAFQYGKIEGITAYFLTHFHSDHYGGLTKNSTLPIYCNRITGNLVRSKLKVAEQYVHVLPMNSPVTVEGVKVILLDANHCPGAAMLLLFLPDGQTVLHTGDFRADPSMETYPELLSCRVQTLYLDTTYCSPEYTFPRQQEVINFAANTAFELVTLNPRTLLVCGSYSVGKEKVFLALAEVLGSKVCLSRDKYNIMCCLESESVRQRITTDWKAAQVHVLPMMQLTFKKMQDHLARFSGQYDQLVAFKPTGWTFSQQVESVEDIQPEISGNISIYGIPYSEHSSFLELKRFVQWLKPLKVIPTVNNGSWDNRRAMEKCFSEWLLESNAKR